MLVAMMDIRIVGMSMLERLMNVQVSVRLRAIPAGAVLMPVMSVMGVHVIVCKRLVAMPVRVMLRQMQPHSRCHE